MKIFIDKEKQQLINAHASLQFKANDARQRARIAESYARDMQARATKAELAIDEYQDSFLAIVANSPYTWIAAIGLLCASIIALVSGI
jgi:hypothetical protein